MGETGSQIIELANIGNADLTIDQIRSTSAEFTIYTQMDPANRLVLPANSCARCHTRCVQSIFSRHVIGALRIDGFWEEGTETLDVLLNGTGVAAEIEINPTGVVDFGYVVLGETEERTQVATNSGDTILQVEAHPETPEVRVDPATFSLGAGNLRASKCLLRRARWASDQDVSCWLATTSKTKPARSLLRARCIKKYRPVQHHTRHSDA